ncbi:MAG: hypothetical protein ACJ719_03555 [Nitrososphaeraceae archaeon]
MTIESVNERQGSDMQSKVEELGEINQSVRNLDKIKDDDDAIAQLSDQLLAISTRLQELKRKQSI